MDALKQWIISLVFSAAAGTLISVISPKGSNDKTVKTVVGIFIIAAVCVPLSEIEASDFSVPAFVQDEIIADNSMNDFTVEMLETELFNKASEVASEFGCSIKDVEIQAEYDDENCIIIHEMTVYFINPENEKVTEIAAKIENELGVPVTVR